MNFRAQSWRAASVRQVGICLVSTLLPSAGIAAPSLTSEMRTGWVSRPYLTVIVSPSLRFVETPAPPHVVPVLMAEPSAPPKAAISSGPTPEPSSGPREPATGPSGAVPSSQGQASAASDAGAAPKEKPERPAKPPPPILPDEIQPKVRPEDFLPYFQFPGSNTGPSDVAPPPEPGKLPPSSATYRQQ